MTSLSTFVPALRYAKWLGIAALCAGLGIQTMRIDHLKRDIAELQEANAQSLQRAEAAARETEHAAAVAVKDANDAKDKEAARARVAAAGARDELGRLRSTLAALGASAADSLASAPSGLDDASRARTVVGLCAESLQRMAETADACESRLTGLQAYVLAIQPKP